MQVCVTVVVVPGGVGEELGGGVKTVVVHGCVQSYAGGIVVTLQGTVPVHDWVIVVMVSGGTGGVFGGGGVSPHASGVNLHGCEYTYRALRKL